MRLWGGSHTSLSITSHVVRLPFEILVYLAGSSHLNVCACAQEPQCVCVAQNRSQFLPSTCRLRRADSSCQAWWQAPLLFKAPHQPTFSHICIPLHLLLLDHYSRLRFQVWIPDFHSSLIYLFIPTSYTAGFQTFPMPTAAILVGTAFPLPVPCEACSSSRHCLFPLLYNLLLLPLFQQGCVSHHGMPSSNSK